MIAKHEPWLAALFGATFTGAGHFFVGAPGAGAAFLAGGLALFAAAAWQLFTPEGSVPLGGGSLVLLFALLALSSLDAHRRAARGAEPGAGGAPAGGKDAWKSVFFSALFPGLGQFHARRPLPAIVFLALGVISALAADWPLVLAYAAVRGASMLDAWRGRELRRGSPFGTERAVVLALTLFAAAQLTLVAFVRARLVRAFRIPSASMSPTLSTGDYLFVDRTRRGCAEAGEILVYRYPPEPATLHLHRCVAVAGQTIEVRDKALWVDGRRLEEPYARHVDPNVRAGGFDPRDNMPRTTVPPGHVYVMGDNRDNANDSRFWGPVATSAVLGRVYKIYWPLDRAGPLPLR